MTPHVNEENWLRFNKKAKIAYLDCETFNTNLNFQVNRPWQVGVLKVIGDQTMEIVDAHINWEDCQFSIGAGAAMITHFDKRKHDLVATDPKTAWNKFAPVLDWADHIIGHNLLRFDIYLIRGYAQYMGMPWKHLLPKIIDTNALARGIKLNRPYRPGSDDFMEYQYRMAHDMTKGVKSSLNVVSKEAGIEFDADNLHDGVQDILLNKRYWEVLRNQVEI